jgi:Protein of unknown function (DUF3945)
LLKPSRCRPARVIVAEILYAGEAAQRLGAESTIPLAGVAAMGARPNHKKSKHACDTTQCKVKIVFLQDKQDFYVNKKYSQLTLLIPDNYLGVEITPDLKTQLEKYNNIGVQKITNKEGKESMGFVSIDKDLKTMIFVPTSNVFIPDKLGENPISERQKESLKAGYTVNYLDYKTKNNELKKKVNLKLSPFIEGKITFSDGLKLNVAEKQKQTNDLKKTNTKSTKLA